MQRPTERLKKKIEKENLWIFILRLLRKRPHYAFEVREHIQKDFGFWIGNVTAYKVLYLLEQGKYVQAEKKERKTYYSLTSAGRAELITGMRLLKALAKD